MTDITVRRDFGWGKTAFSMWEFYLWTGKRFHAYQYDTTQTTNNTIQLCFKTPTALNVLMKASFSCQTGGHMTIAEAATWTRTYQGSQTMANILCTRRQEPQSSGLLNNGAQTTFNAGGYLVTEPQSLVNTTEISRVYDFGSYKAMGKQIAEEAILLKKATQYAVQVTADAPGNKSFLKLEWSEFNVEEK